MILTDLEDELVFDDIPKLYDAKHKVFITHLHHLDEMIAPKKFPRMFTTPGIAAKMKLYFKKRQITCNNFIVLKPYQPYEFKLCKGNKVQVLLCEAHDYTNNLMVLIRKDKVVYMYTNIYTDIRTALFNNNFAKWIAAGVSDLYVNLARAEEQSDPNELEHAIDGIIEEFISNKNICIKICVPLLGYENFIFALAQRLPQLVYLDKTFESFMSVHLSKFEFAKLSTEARIVIVNKFPPIEVEFRRMSLIPTKALNVKHIKWSPLPTAFDLELLARLVHPQRIFGIINVYNMERQVPHYLWSLTTKAIQKHKSQTNTNNESLLSTQEPTTPVRSNHTSTAKDTNIVRYVKKLNYLDTNTDSDSQ